MEGIVLRLCSPRTIIQLIYLQRAIVMERMQMEIGELWQMLWQVMHPKIWKSKRFRIINIFIRGPYSTQQHHLHLIQSSPFWATLYRTSVTKLTWWVPRTNRMALAIQQAREKWRTMEAWAWVMTARPSTILWCTIIHRLISRLSTF